MPKPSLELRQRVGQLTEAMLLVGMSDDEVTYQALLETAFSLSLVAANDGENFQNYVPMGPHGDGSI